MIKVRNIFLIVICCLLIFDISSVIAGGSVRVRGYTRKDGTYVSPHYRSAPDGNFGNNWSTKGNINPYTGAPGTKVTPPNHYGYPRVNSLPSYKSNDFKLPEYKLPEINLDNRGDIYNGFKNYDRSSFEKINNQNEQLNNNSQLNKLFGSKSLNNNPKIKKGYLSDLFE